MTGFSERYGPWALVAGASEGIGAAFATALAGRGLDLVLVARRPGPLTALTDRLPVRTLTVAADLATTAGLAAVEEATRDLEVGLVVVNAAYSPIGRLIDQDPAETLRALDLNCRAPLVLAHLEAWNWGRISVALGTRCCPAGRSCISRPRPLPICTSQGQMCSGCARS